MGDKSLPVKLRLGRTSEMCKQANEDTLSGQFWEIRTQTGVCLSLFGVFKTGHQSFLWWRKNACLDELNMDVPQLSSHTLTSWRQSCRFNLRHWFPALSQFNVIKSELSITLSTYSIQYVSCLNMKIHPYLFSYTISVSTSDKVVLLSQLIIRSRQSQTHM